jgi:inner membrane protein
VLVRIFPPRGQIQETRMDPVSQAVVGAAVAQAALTGRLGKRAFACGAVGGLLPDLDVLIRSSADPLLAVEMHRHFTHALAMVPLGGLIAALPFLARRKSRQDGRAVLAASLLGYLSHAPLDVFTSYGTLWRWPFSGTRLELDWISIVDPLFTIPLLILTLVARARSSGRIALLALAFALAYIGLGGLLHHRAQAVQTELAASRGHVVERGRVMPTLGNMIVWRSLYRSGGELHADAIRVLPFGPAAVVEGGSIARATAPPPGVAVAGAVEQRFARDLARFAWFADGFVARDPADPTVFADMRYSLDTSGFEPLWGVRFHTDGREDPVEWVELMRHGERAAVELWQLVTGRSPHLRAWLL